MNIPSDDEINILRRIIEMHPTDVKALFDLGVASFSRVDYDTAIRMLRRTLNSPHYRSHAMRLLADAYEAKGMSEHAARMRKQISTEK